MYGKTFSPGVKSTKSYEPVALSPLESGIANLLGGDDTITPASVTQPVAEAVVLEAPVKPNPTTVVVMAEPKKPTIKEQLSKVPVLVWVALGIGLLWLANSQGWINLGGK